MKKRMMILFLLIAVPVAWLQAEGLPHSGVESVSEKGAEEAATGEEEEHELDRADQTGEVDVIQEDQGTVHSEGEAAGDSESGTETSEDSPEISENEFTDPTEEEIESAAENLIDPFATTLEMKINSEVKIKKKKNEFQPTDAPAPKITLKGYIEDQNSRMAMIEIQSFGVYLVEEKDHISLQSNGKNMVLRIKKLSHQRVLVEIGTLGQVIVVR